MSLDWANERYIRVYTRDTDEWLVLPWQSRAVWPLIMRKAERTGFIPARLGPRGVAVLIGLPADVVEPGIIGLLEDGCLAKVEGGYFIPNFLEAQETRSSDAQRQRDSRERRRAEKMREVTGDVSVSQNVTAASPPVTTGHIESPDVTLYSAVPCRAELISDSLSRGAPAQVRDPVAVAPAPAPTGWAAPLLEHAVRRLDEARAQLDPAAKRIGSSVKLPAADASMLLARLRAVDERERQETLDHCLDVLIRKAQVETNVGLLRVRMLAGDAAWERWRTSTVEAIEAEARPRAPPASARRDPRVGYSPARPDSHSTPDGEVRILTEL